MSGTHEDGLGWNPNGVFCGECSNNTCELCIQATLTQDPYATDQPKQVIYFTLCSERLPEKSGDYVCVINNGHFSELQYSSVHEAFNAADWEDEPATEIKVTAWAEIPEWAKVVRE